MGIYIADYVPMQVQGIISDLVDSICTTHETLNSIAEDNGLTLKGEDKVVSEPIITVKETEDRITRIVQSFENNTTGLDIPFPLISLSDSQRLLPENELKELVANETILSLTEAGYLEGVDSTNFENILLGKTPINFSVIQKINANAGDKFNYRFWGTFGPGDEALYAWRHKDTVVYTKSEKVTQYTRLFNDDFTPYTGSSFKIFEKTPENFVLYYVEGDEKVEADRDTELDVNSNALAQLTSFYIKKSFKDRYRTLPCTKLISATKNARLYFACPNTEKNIKFYINSKRVMLNSFPINLGYTDAYGNSLIYNVYYTETGYNSNSTMLEIRQGV